jgi:hypothetical protein
MLVESIVTLQRTFLFMGPVQSLMQVVRFRREVSSCLENMVV